MPDPIDEPSALLQLKLYRVRSSCLVLARALETFAEDPLEKPGDQMDRLHGVVNLLELVAHFCLEGEQHA